MSVAMLIILYVGPALTLMLMRLDRAQPVSESILAGLIWPLEILLGGIEAMFVPIEHAWLGKTRQV